MMRKVLTLAFMLLAGEAFAGSGTVDFTAGSGLQMPTTTDAGGKHLPHGVSCDAVAGANCVTVLAPSTPAVAGNTSSVVQLNPIGIGGAVGLPIFVSPGTGATWAAAQSGTWTVQPGNTANTTPWLATINQGGNSAAVKAASTAPVATDPALVTVPRPDVIQQVGSGIVVRCYPPGGGMAAALHAAGTALGNARTCANSFRSAAANSGTLSAVSSTWYIGVTPQVTVLLFSRALTTSTCTDNSAVVITDVDLEYMFATVTLNHEAYSAFSSGSFGISRFVQEVASTDSFTSLYMCVVADTAVTPTGGFDNYVGLHMNRH